MNAPLLADLRRFFMLAAPDTGRAAALERGDLQAIAGHLLPYMANGNASEKRNARALMARIEKEPTP